MQAPAITTGARLGSVVVLRFGAGVIIITVGVVIPGVAVVVVPSPFCKTTYRLVVS